MSRKIALAGGGGAEDSRLIDEYFAQWHGQNGKMLYIPIAMRNGNYSFPDCYIWMVSTLEPVGISQIEMWTDLGNHHARELEQFDSIYIGGGNTYLLLSELVDSGFDEIFRWYVNEGMPIYGGSAGAVVLGKDIRTVEHIDSNDIGLERNHCLDLALGYSIWVHYQPVNDPLIEKYVYATENELLAISERTGVIIEGDSIRTVGFEKAYRFADGKKHEIQ